MFQVHHLTPHMWNSQYSLRMDVYVSCVYVQTSLDVDKWAGEWHLLRVANVGETNDLTEQTKIEREQK